MSWVTEHVEDRGEEAVNCATHAIGGLLAALGWIILKARFAHLGWPMAAASVFCLSITSMFCFSSIYHGTPASNLKVQLRKADHVAIYGVIAGSYTPFCQMIIPADPGHKILLAVWILAIIGSIFEASGGLHYSVLSMVFYLSLSWAAIGLIPYFLALSSILPLVLLLIGGLCYTLGTFFYATHHFRFSHAVWHLFVIAACGFHYWAVWELLLLQ